MVKNKTFYLNVFLKTLQNFVVNFIKILMKIFSSLFYFCLRQLKGFFYFLTESLTRSELACLLLFVIFFIFTDRRSNKTIKFEKTKAPNVLWRILAFYMYLPLWKEFVYPCFMFYAQRSHPLYVTFNYAFSSSVNEFFRYTYYIESIFNNTFIFIGLYQCFLYYFARLIVKVIPEKIFHLPMFIRYHMMVNSLLIVIFQIIEEPYRLIAGITPDSSGIYLEQTTKNLDFAMNLSFCMVIFYSLTLGNCTWQACRGQSFTNIKGFFDILIRTHLGFDTLYIGEKWSQYGMDELSDYNDESDDD